MEISRPKTFLDKDPLHVKILLDIVVPAVVLFRNYDATWQAMHVTEKRIRTFFSPLLARLATSCDEQTNICIKERQRHLRRCEVAVDEIAAHAYEHLALVQGAESVTSNPKFTALTFDALLVAFVNKLCHTVGTRFSLDFLKLDYLGLVGEPLPEDMHVPGEEELFPRSQTVQQLLPPARLANAA